jgi:hypothetical protein
MRPKKDIENFVEALEMVDKINSYNRQVIIDTLKWILTAKSEVEE